MKPPADSVFGVHNDRLLFTPLLTGDELGGVLLGDGRRGVVSDDRSRLILFLCFFELGRGVSVKVGVDFAASVATRLVNDSCVTPECNSVGSGGTGTSAATCELETDPADPDLRSVLVGWDTDPTRS